MADSFYEKVSRSIAEYNRRSKSPYDLSISCGYKAGKPKTLKEIDDLMKASDREMYTQKRRNKRADSLKTSALIFMLFEYANSLKKDLQPDQNEYNAACYLCLALIF